MNRSEAINELVSALAKAQGAFKPILKDADNPAFRSKYADLSTIIEATRPALNANGLVIIQGVQCELDTQATKIETLLAHTSGQWISDELHLPATMRDRFDAQAVGSSQTYGRRYAMQAMLGVAAFDDDGNAAAGVGSKEAAQAVGQTKIKELEQKKKPNGSAPEKPQDTKAVINISYPPEWLGDALISGGATKNLELALQMSLHGSKTTNEGEWRIPGGAFIKFHDICRSEGISVIEGSTSTLTVNTTIVTADSYMKPQDTRSKIESVKVGKGKAEGCMFVLWEKEELSCWNKGLHPYLKAGVPADFEVTDTSKGGKVYHNLQRAISIGDVKFSDDNKPMLDVNREIATPPPIEELKDIDEYIL
jgi:hypothetical protein